MFLFLPHDEYVVFPVFPLIFFFGFSYLKFFCWFVDFFLLIYRSCAVGDDLCISDFLSDFNLCDFSVS